MALSPDLKGELFLENCFIDFPFCHRYKKELSSAVEREASLERCKAQLELDWQRRYEDLERQQYEKSEDLIRKLTKSRDEVSPVIERGVTREVELD